MIILLDKIIEKWGLIYTGILVGDKRKDKFFFIWTNSLAINNIIIYIIEYNNIDI